LKVIILSVLAALAFAYAASFLLSREQEPVYEAYVGSGARVGDPGHNLVGPNWTGLPGPGSGTGTPSS
jgi:hypothetical protein